MKKLTALLLCLCLTLSLAGCSSESGQTGDSTEANISEETDATAPAGIYTPGTYEGTARGYGGDITVTVTVDANAITDVQITGDSETPGIGSNAVEQLPALILEAQSAEVDGISGCTYSSNAIKEAAQEALDQAAGKAESSGSELTMTDGTYTAQTVSYAEVNGLATEGQLTMSVTIADNQITDISVDEYTDTDIIGGMAFPILAEEVIASQSLAVDTISGATVSSNAFLTALTDCIRQAGGDPSVLSAREVIKPDAQTSQYDTQILVIGAGMAGLTAAIEAASQGAEVLLLEKNEVLSSSTTRSLGFIVGAGTATQEAAGISDNADAFYEDIYELYQDEEQLDTDLLRYMADHSGELNAWLADNGVEFTGVINKSVKGPRATERIHTTAGGSYLTSTLKNRAEELGVTILMGTPAVSLIQNEDGAVTGCKATNKYGDDITVNAQATIVCAGSYTNDPELFAQLNPRIDNITYSCGCGDGDAYRWFEEVGADLINIPYTQFMYYSYSPSFPEFPEVIPNSPDNPVYEILLVDGGGERVTAEDNFCFEFTKENWDRGYSEGYCVVGQDFADRYPILMDDVMNSTVPSSGLPYAYCEDTIEALAEDVGIDPATLSATVERYNELCRAEEDTDFGKDAQYLEELEGPYYIIRLPMVSTDGYSGARINTEAQVLDSEGSWIEGLYAAGSCAVGQTVSVNYFGCGTSLMTCGVFGRAAASSAVESLQ